MNVFTIAGNIGRDARLNSVSGQNGPISVLNFAVAVQKRQKGPDGKPLTLWVDCALWGTRADVLAQYLTKGTKVTVTGEADVEAYQANDGTIQPKLMIRVNDVTLQGAAGQTGGTGQQAPAQQQAPAYRAPAQPAAQQRPAAPAQRDPMEPPIYFDDDIPF